MMPFLGQSGGGGMESVCFGCRGESLLCVIYTIRGLVFWGGRAPARRASAWLGGGVSRFRAGMMIMAM
eukprot:scaffold606117_cov17-Prasinocladus_malaysianus.AAC.1